MSRSFQEETQRQVVFSKIATALSPSEGLIADSLMGTVHALTDTMNGELRKVWAKPLRIEPCQNKNGELDYVFPLTVGDTKTGREISFEGVGSSSQEDVINLVFKVAAQFLMGLRDFPLFIDELGRSFDDHHRTSVMRYIQGLRDSHFFSQIFFINHFQSQYGSIDEVEIVVFDETNLVVPSVYNPVS